MKQPLSTRYSSAITTALERAGFRVDAFSTAGDTLTVEAQPQAILEAVIAAGGILLDSVQQGNRTLVIMRMESQIVSIKHVRGEIFTTVLHWHPKAKFEKIRNSG